MGAMFDSIENHYRFSSGRLNEVKGYEFYGKMAKTYAKLNADEEAKAKAVAFYRSLHAAGTAEQVLEKFRYVHSTVALEHVVNTFGFGGMPIDKLRRSYQLFAERILPVLQHDAAFKLPTNQNGHTELAASA